MKTLLLFGFSCLSFAQTFDAEGGWTSINLSGHPAKQTATCSQSGTTQTCTVTNGSVFKLNEPMLIKATGTAMDWVYAANDTLVGASKITNIVSNTLTLTAHSSATVGATAGTIAPAFYYTQNLSGRWWLGNHFDHGMFFQGIGPMLLPATNKYGCAGGQCAAAANAIFSEIKSWGFNGIGNDVGGFFAPIGGSCSNTCGPLPQVMNDSGDLYSIIANVNGGVFAGYGTHPVKDLGPSLNATLIAPNSFAIFMDYFDPGFSAFLTDFFANFGGAVALGNNPMIVGITVGSADQFYGLGAGPDFDTVPAGRQQGDVGWLVMASSPLETYNSQTGYAGLSVPYADPKIYVKTAASFNPYGSSATPSVPSVCAIATPCSLRDFLAKKYGTIGALNTAWGSSYSTFDSAGTPVTAETFGTGTGSATSFNHTFAHAPDPNSIQVLVNGTVIGGDCPNFRGFNPCTPGAGKGNFGGGTITLASSSLTYSTGVATIVFSAPPANGAAITVNYTFGGWGTGTGLMDEDGRNTTVMGRNGICLQPVADATTSGTASYACRPSNPNGIGAPDAQATFAADIDEWISQYAGKYESSIATSFRATNPHLLLFSPETTGTWSAPANHRLNEGLAPYVDVFFTNVLMNQPDNTQGQSMYAYISKAFPGAMFNLVYPNACQDSATAGVQSGTCSGVFSQSTQPLRATQYYNMVNLMLSANSFNSTHQWVGLDWWQLHDNDGPDSPVNNWGLKTSTDNAYDGSEAASGVVTCSAPLAAFICGSEPAPGGSAVRPFGDALGGATGVKAANALWFAGGGGSTTTGTVTISGSVTVQ